MKIALINNHTKHLLELQTLLQNYGLVTVFEYSPELDWYFANNFDLLVLSGGPTPFSKNFAGYWDNQFNFIINSAVPIIGICLGFELICLAFEQGLSKHKIKKRGLQSVVYNSKTYKVWESHFYYLKQAKTPLQSLATSGSEIQIIKHISKPIFGLQFHPEVREEGSTGHLIFEGLVGNVLKNITINIGL